MAKVSLQFLETEVISLENLFFSHPLLTETRRSVRGKSGGALHGYHTFQWTPAVQALCVLLLRAKLDSDSQDFVAPHLTGGIGTLAASLDFAITKQPLWMTDTFGLDNRGECLVRRLVERTNSERKRGGDVSLSIKRSQLTPADINIQVGRREVTSLDEIGRLIQAIESLHLKNKNTNRPTHINRRQAYSGLHKILTSTRIGLLPWQCAADVEASLAGTFLDEIISTLVLAKGTTTVLPDHNRPQPSGLSNCLTRLMELNCDFGITGRLRQLNDEFKLQIHLIHTRFGEIHWTTSYSAGADGCAELAVQVASDLFVQVSKLTGACLAGRAA